MAPADTRDGRSGNLSMRSAVVLLLLFCFAAAGLAQKADLPDPVKFRNKFDMVANAALAVLKEKYDIELDDRIAGIITTRPYEFITGSLTESEFNKVAINKNVSDGHWLKARYVVQVVLQTVSPTETLVAVHTDIEALRRNIDGTEQWLPLESRGVYEKRILGQVSGILMGNTKEKEKEGFWGQRPQPIDTRPSRFPTLPDR